MIIVVGVCGGVVFVVVISGGVVYIYKKKLRKGKDTRGECFAFYPPLWRYGGRPI